MDSVTEAETRDRAADAWCASEDVAAEPRTTALSQRHESEESRKHPCNSYGFESSYAATGCSELSHNEDRHRKCALARPLAIGGLANTAVSVPAAGPTNFCSLHRIPVLFGKASIIDLGCDAPAQERTTWTMICIRAPRMIEVSLAETSRPLELHCILALSERYFSGQTHFPNTGDELGIGLDPRMFQHCFQWQPLGGIPH